MELCKITIMFSFLLSISIYLSLSITRNFSIIILRNSVSLSFSIYFVPLGSCSRLLSISQSLQWHFEICKTSSRMFAQSQSFHNDTSSCLVIPNERIHCLSSYFSFVIHHFLPLQQKDVVWWFLLWLHHRAVGIPF